MHAGTCRRLLHSFLHACSKRCKQRNRSEDREEGMRSRKRRFVSVAGEGR